MKYDITNEEKEALKMYKGFNYEAINGLLTSNVETDIALLKDALKTGKVEVVPIDNSDFGNIPLLPVSIDGTICVCPTELYEGFFVAKLVKGAR